jgi:hypothetical protein
MADGSRGKRYWDGDRWDGQTRGGSTEKPRRKFVLPKGKVGRSVALTLMGALCIGIVIIAAISLGFGREFDPYRAEKGCAFESEVSSGGELATESKRACAFCERFCKGP